MSEVEKKKKDIEPEQEEEELEFELITSARQLAAPPKLRHVIVSVPEWLTTSGKAAKFMVWENSASDYAEFLESGWTYKDGLRTRYDSKDEDVRFLAHTLRDQHGNRLWNKVADAKAVLGQLGKGTLNTLLTEATRLNSAKEQGKEGNSVETESAS